MFSTSVRFGRKARSHASWSFSARWQRCFKTKAGLGALGVGTVGMGVMGSDRLQSVMKLTGLGNRGSFQVSVRPTSEHYQLSPSSSESAKVPACSNVHCIVLLGCTGHGKSHSGNTLCGTCVFEASDKLASKTESVEQSGLFQYKGISFNVIDTPGFFDTALSLDEIQKRLAVICNFAPRGLSAIILVTNGRATPENQKVLNYITQQFGSDALSQYGLLLFTKSDKKPSELHQEIQDLPDSNEYKQMIKCIPKERLLSLPLVSDSWWGWQTNGKAQEQHREQILDTIIEMHQRRSAGSSGVDECRLDCETFRQNRIKTEEQILKGMLIARHRADLKGSLSKLRGERNAAWFKARFEKPIDDLESKLSALPSE